MHHSIAVEGSLAESINEPKQAATPVSPSILSQERAQMTDIPTVGLSLIRR